MRDDEQKKLLFELTSYLDANNPPFFTELILRIKPLLRGRYYTYEELLEFVNTRVYPLELVLENTDNIVITSVDPKTLGLKMIDTRKVPQKNELNHLILQPSYYDKQKGTFTVPGYEPVLIAKWGKTHNKDNVEYAQCRLMRLVFNNVNTLQNGVSYHRVLSVHERLIDNKKRAKVKNNVDEINRKLTDKLGYKKIIKMQKNRVFINSSYL